MTGRHTLAIEGYTQDELLALLDEDTGWVFTAESPSSSRLAARRCSGSSALTDTTLVVELAQIDGGGEGILQQLAALLKRFAQRRKLKAVEWFVYAVHCANPNLKLRAVLERKGFTLRTPPGKGECYYLRVDV